MASQHPAPTEADNPQQQGETPVQPQQTGTPMAPQHTQQQHDQQQHGTIFRDFASI